MPAEILNTQADLKRWLGEIDRPLVFSNGCFDILHRGHVHYLQQAAALGSTLIVALNSDESVRRLGKGETRPINPLEDRMAVIAGLASVDAVCAFDTDTPLDLIKLCQPDHLVKGGDWPVDQIVGYREAKAWGGQTHSIAFEYERSTTTLLEKVRANSKKGG